jgi:hypothetical protein
VPRVGQDLLVIVPVELIRQFETQLGDLGEDRVGGQLPEDLVGRSDRVRGEQDPPGPLRLRATRAGRSGPAVLIDEGELGGAELVAAPRTGLVRHRPQRLVGSRK